MLSFNLGLMGDTAVVSELVLKFNIAKQPVRFRACRRSRHSKQILEDGLANAALPIFFGGEFGQFGAGQNEV